MPNTIIAPGEYPSASQHPMLLTDNLVFYFYAQDECPIEHRSAHRGYEDAPRSYSNNNDSYQYSHHHHREEDWKCLEVKF